MLASAPSFSSDARPNIVIILADNQPASLLGTYGNKDVKTPNIDNLAKEGLQFNHFYASNGMCSPTRATLMTGLMPSQHGVHNWLDDAQLDEWPKDWSVVAEFRTLPLTLRNHGYRTAMIGKWHLGQPWKASIGYEHWVTFTDGHTIDFWDNTVIDNDKSYRVSDTHIVDFFANKAVEYIKNRHADEPFYLQLNFDGPYLNPPTNIGPARNRHYEGYLGQTFESFPREPVNENILNQLTDPKTPLFLRNMHRNSILHHNDHETMANVASQNTIVDDGVGRVLKALEEAGLSDNTLVIYTSDQGNFYGQHGLWQHTVVTSPTNLYETAMNVPLIVRHPGNIEAGTRNQLVAQYDLPQTVLDYAGLGEIHFDKSPGQSFLRLLKEDSVPGNPTVFFEQEETRGLRTARYAYWQRIEGVGESVLFDMKVDPEQKNNLAGNPEYDDVVKELEARLSTFFAKYSDKKYDLWRAGAAKGSVARPGMFRTLYGEDWKTVSESLPPFDSQ
jgi:arylsulfatase A-like enzyme